MTAPGGSESSRKEMTGRRRPVLLFPTHKCSPIPLLSVPVALSYRVLSLSAAISMLTTQIIVSHSVPVPEKKPSWARQSPSLVVTHEPSGRQQAPDPAARTVIVPDIPLAVPSPLSLP